MNFVSCFSGIEAASVAWEPLGFKCLGVAEVDTFPCAVLAHHYPDVPNLGDVLADDFLERVATLKPDILVGGPPCFVAGTLILTRLGLKPIEEIVEGDEVLTHQRRWRRVTATMRREADTFLVRGQGHHGIETTAEHPFYARNVRRDWIVGSKKTDGPSWSRTPEEPRWVEASELHGQYWSSPAAMPSDADPIEVGGGATLFPREVTPELMWVLGAWLGDGWIRNTKKQAHLLLCCARHEADIVEGRLRDAGFDAYRSEERTTTRFMFGSRDLAEWTFANFGKGAAGKSIPTWILCAAQPLRQAFYDGYHHADGATVTQPKGGGVVDTFTTISKGIAIGLRLLTNTLGLSSTVHYTKRPPQCVIEGRTVNQSNTYRVRVYASARSAFFDQGMAWGKVRHAAPTGHRAEVFNFEVDEDNSYVADGLVVHNCQDFSVAGLRAGIDGHRGNLTLRWVQIIHASNARFAVTENVPGWLSANKGHAFGAFLAGLVGHDTDLLPPKGCGGKWTNAGMVDGPEGRACWRILDAQFFGLAQRRKRVFVVFCPRNGADPASVLFESESLRRHSSPSRETRQGVAPTLESRTDAGGSGWGTDWLCDGGAVATDDVAFGGNRLSGPIDVATALTAHGGPHGRMDFERETFITTADVAQTMASGYARNYNHHEAVASHLVTQTHADIAQAITAGFADDYNNETKVTGHLVTSTLPMDTHLGGDIINGLDANYGKGPGSRGAAERPVVVTHALRADGFDASEDGTGRGTPIIGTASAVRRLTPTEAERLQGFPDGYTVIPFRGREAADGPRYKSLGNSMAVPVMKWIGQRIQMVAKQ